MATHECPFKCPYEEGCSEAKASKKEISRHVWAWHKQWATRTGYQPIDALCSGCGINFTRADNLKQHVDEGRCKGAVEEGSDV